MAEHTMATGSVLGADSEHLTQLAREAERQSELLASLERQLSMRVEQVFWIGSDQQRFRTTWIGQHAPDLKATTQLLEQIAARIRMERETQEAASAGRTMGETTVGTFLDYSEQGDGRQARVFGNLEKADRVAIYVPGMTTEHDGANSSATALYEQLLSDAAPGASVAVVTGLVYDPPDGVDGASTSAAYEGRDALRGLVDQVRALAPDAEVSIVGHSYGTTVTGATLKSDGGLDVDRVIALGSPGMTVDHVNEFASPSTEVWAAASMTDPVPVLPGIGKSVPILGTIIEEIDRPFGSIPIVGGLVNDLVGDVESALLGTSFIDHSTNFGFGIAPTDSDFGAKEFDVGDAFGHSEYFSDPNSRANIAAIVLGDDPAE